MQKIEFTSKLVLAIIGLTAVGAILVPTYAVPTIRSADIFDESILSADIKNGEVKNSDLGTDAVTTGKIKNGEVTTDDIKDATIQAGDIATGVIPDGGGAVQLDVHIVVGEHVTVLPGSFNTAYANCPTGEILTGGGFEGQAGEIDIAQNEPYDSDTWMVSGHNSITLERDLIPFALCIDPSIP